MLSQDQAPKDRFRSVYAWLIADLVGREKLAIARVVALSLVGVGARLASLAIVLLFIRTRSQTVELFGVELPSESSLTAVGLYAFSALAFAVFAAATTYASEAVSFTTARRYVESAYSRVLRRVETGSTPNADEPARTLTRILSASMIMCVRLFVVQLTSLGPLLLALVAASVLVVIQPWITLAIALLAAVLFVPFRRLNRAVAHASEVREAEAKATSRLASATVAQLLGLRPVPEEASQRSREFATLPPVRRGLDAFRDILLIRRKVSMLREIGLGGALAVLVLGFGLRLQTTDPQWDLVLAYLIALQWCVTGGARVASTITSMSRFLPQVERYVDFVRTDSAEKAPEQEAGPLSLEKLGVSTDASIAVVIPGREWTSALPEIVEQLATVTGESSDALEAAAVLVLTSPEDTAGFLRALEAHPGTARIAIVDGNWWAKRSEEEIDRFRSACAGAPIVALCASWPHACRHRTEAAFEPSDDGLLPARERVARERRRADSDVDDDLEL